MDAIGSAKQTHWLNGAAKSEIQLIGSLPKILVLYFFNYNLRTFTFFLQRAIVWKVAFVKTWLSWLSNF